MNGFKYWIARLSLVSLVMLSGCGGGEAEIATLSNPPITLNARLSSANLLLPDGRYALIYRFIPTSSGEAAISMSSGSLRCSLSVQEKSNTPEKTASSTPSIATLSDATGTATVIVEVVAGRSYLVTASTKSPAAVGDFTLSYPFNFKLDGYEFQNYN